MLALAGILVALVMAALAIDISTLYLAHSEAQRTADAAALAGARAFVVSATTSDLGPSSQTVARALALQLIGAVLQQNLIAGQPGQLTPPLGTYPIFDYSNPSNPKITVSVQQQNLPTFFSRIWNRVPNTVSAIATAEAYNPSGSSANPPVSAQCVKPFIVPNQDPEHPTGPTTFQPFINLGDGAITNPGRIWSFGAGVVGEWITFNVNCLGVVPGCPAGPAKAQNNPPSHCTPLNTNCSLDFVPAAPPASPLSCPSCGGGGRQLEQNIACCNTAALSCNSATPMTQMITDLNGPPPPHASVDQGLQCLIHQNPTLGMDSLDPTGFPFNGGAPFRFVAGANNPLTLAPNPVVASGDGVSTSDSIITLLIADSFNTVPTPPTADIVGFMQVFIVQGNGGGGFTGVVLNVSGCGTTAGTAAPIVGGGISPIPVRLIHN
jgi:hypothetical protein